MGEMVELYALAWEARRRGTSYGKLVGQLTDFEVLEIVKKYKRKKGTAGKKRDEKRH